MKKTLAILLSCVVLVAAFFAVAMITSSAATEVTDDAYAYTVEVTLKDGTVVYLGKQPDGTGYSDTNIINYVDLGEEGTMEFNHTNGTLTINNVKLQRIVSKTGTLVLNVEGDSNNIEYTGTADNGWYAVQVNYQGFDGSTLKNVGSLIITGSGRLTAKAKNYTLTSSAGNFEIKGDVYLNLSTEETNSVTIHVGHIAGYDQGYLRIGGNAEIDSEGSITLNNDALGKVYITENSDVYVNVDFNDNKWARCIISNKGGIEITGGTTELNGAGYAALHVQESTIDIKGGKVTSTDNVRFIRCNGKYTISSDAVIDVTMREGSNANKDAGTAKEGSVALTGTSTFYSGTTPASVACGKAAIDVPAGTPITKNVSAAISAKVDAQTVSVGTPYEKSETKIYWVAGNTLTVSKDRFVRVNASLNDDISITYYAIYDAATANKVKFTVNTTVNEVNGVFDEETGLYAYRFDGIAPQMMGDNIKAELLPSEGDVAVATKDTYSVKQYLEETVALDPNNDALKNLVNDLLVYGAAAQNYKEYKTDALVSEKTPDFNTLEASKSVAAVKNVSNVSFTFANVLFDSVNKIVVKFTAQDLTGVTFKYSINGGAEKVLAVDGNQVMTEGIAASDFDKAVIITAYGAENAVLAKVRYSVNSYVVAKQNDATVGTLAQATYNYGVAALAYANAQ